LRLVGVPECIATTEEEYLDIVLKLIHDDAYRESIRQKILQADLDATIYSTADAKYFLTAVDQIVAHHPQWKNQTERPAITIEREKSEEAIVVQKPGLGKDLGPKIKPQESAAKTEKKPGKKK